LLAVLEGLKGQQQTVNGSGRGVTKPVKSLGQLLLDVKDLQGQLQEWAS
jgi:ribosomal protein RSM22 (predicted rRNA methylase)